MKDPKEKPSLSFTVEMGKGPPPKGGSSSYDKKDEPEEMSEAHEAAREELADVLGVPEEKREAFFDALTAFLHTCC